MVTLSNRGIRKFIVLSRKSGSDSDLGESIGLWPITGHTNISKEPETKPALWNWLKVRKNKAGGAGRNTVSQARKRSQQDVSCHMHRFSACAWWNVTRPECLCCQVYVDKWQITARQRKWRKGKAANSILSHVQNNGNTPLQAPTGFVAFSVHFPALSCSTYPVLQWELIVPWRE